jgi:hypothetical protein
MILFMAWRFPCCSIAESSIRKRRHGAVNAGRRSTGNAQSCREGHRERTAIAPPVGLEISADLEQSAGAALSGSQTGARKKFSRSRRRVHAPAVRQALAKASLRQEIALQTRELRMSRGSPSAESTLGSGVRRSWKTPASYLACILRTDTMNLVAIPFRVPLVLR